MGNCNFSSKFLPLVRAKFEEFQSDPEKFRAFLDQNFNPEAAESVYQMFYTPVVTPVGQVEVAEVQDFDTEIDEDPVEIEEYHTKQTFVTTTSDSVDELFVGRAQDKSEMLQNFRREILGCSRLSIDWNNPNAPIESIDANAKSGKTTVLNDNILKYKIRLLNTILSETGGKPVEYDAEMTDERLAEIITNTLQTNVELSENAYNAYVILSKFDDLLRAEAPYIKVKREYVDGENNIEGVDKYEYLGATVQHFTGWTMSEFADSMDQASLLAKTVLECIPEIVNGKPVKGSQVGLSGFYSCMSAMRDCLMYHPTNEMIAIREELKKGDDANMYEIINMYIKFLQSFEEKSMDQYYKKHVSYLLGKLEGIKEYLFKSDAIKDGKFIDPNLKSIFKQMFFKNVQMGYVGYTRDTTSGEIEGKDLKGSFINTQTYNALDNMAAAIYKFRTISKAWEPIVTKYGIKPIAHGTFELKDGTTLSATTCISNMKDSTLIKLFQDVTGIILPNDFIEVYKQVQGDDYRDALLKIVHTVINAVEHNVDTENNFPTTLRQDHFKTVAPIGKVLSIVFGSNTANVVKNVTRKNNLPLFGLNSLAYNFPYIMWQHLDNKDPNNIYEDSYLFERIGTKRKGEKYFEQQCLVMEPSVRSEVYYNGQLKSVDALTFGEVMRLAMLSDFYQKVMDETSEAVGLQNATFADKGTHFLINYRLDSKILSNGMTLREMIKSAMNGNSNPMIDLMYSVRSARFYKLKQNICSDYNTVFGKSFKSLAEIDQFLKANPNINVAEEFAKVDGVDYYEEIHFSPKGGGFSETLLQTEKDLSTAESFKQRLNREKRMFVKDLIKSGFKLNVHLDESVKGVSKKFDKSWTDEQGNLILAKQNGVPIKLNRHNAESILEGPDITLHPMLEGYFMSDTMLSHEYNDVMIGGEYCHPGNSESSRLIAQIKRSVIFGATQHSFTQNLPNGVSEEIKIAVMPDMPGSVRNIIGEEDNGFKSMDGAGLCTALQARLESNSLLDARTGYDKKTIGHDIDARYGRPTLLKWAVYAMTNARRRVSYRSVASQEELTKQCYSAEPINVSLEWLNDALALQDVYYYDIENTNAHYKIVRFEQGADGGIVRVVAKCDEYGNITGEEILQNLGTLNTLYAIDQAFGGAWCMSNVNGKLKYSETNIDALEKFVTDNQSAKNAQVAYLVNKSAIKVGAGNINEQSAWQGKSNLRTISMKTRYLGVQMDAEHHLEESEVTEMTQMISALSQAGYTSKLVNSIYEDIGRVVDESLSEYKAAEQKGDDAIYQILGRAFIESFEQNDRDTIGLAQAFVLKAAKYLKEGGETEYRIPFSADTVSGLFISTVSSNISKKGIRRKYDGFAGVLSPSFNQIQYYRIGGTACLFEDFAKIVHKRGIVGDGIRSAVDIAMNDIVINGALNPFIIPIKQNEIDYEDTIVIQNADGSFREPIYVKSHAEYSQLKHNQYPGCKFYNFTSKPKNLKDVDTKFEVGGETYSIQDLDSVKASYFLQDRPEIITTNGDPSKTAEVAIRKKGIDTLSHPDADGMHFGNPFTHFDYNGVVKPATAKDSVTAYEQWLRGTAYQDVEPERRAWIVEQIQNGSLKGKPLVYHTDRIPDNSYGVDKYDYETAPSHAHILQKLIYESEDDVINSVLGGQRINVQSEDAVVTETTEITTEPTIQSASGIVYNQEQLKAISGVSTIIKNTLANRRGGPSFVTIQGKAGTGKTTIINEILAQSGITPGSVKIEVSAVSHKAKNVLSQKIDEEYKVSAHALAGALGMNVRYLKDGTEEWVRKVNPTTNVPIKAPVDSAQVLFVDEASMLTEEHLEHIQRAVQNRNVTVVFIGDVGQISPIRSEKMQQQYGVPSWAPSPIFTRSDIPVFELTNRVRQGEDSPVLAFADEYYNFNTGKTNQFPQISGSSSDGRLVVQNGNVDLTDQLLDLFIEAKETLNPNKVKIVAAKNATVDAYNRAIQRVTNPQVTDDSVVRFGPGDLVIFNDNIYYNEELVAANADEGQIVNVDSNIMIEDGIEYYTVTFQNTQGEEIPVKIPVQTSDNIQRYVTLDQTLRKAASWIHGRPPQSATEAYDKFKNKFAAKVSRGTMVPTLALGYAITSDKSQGSTYEVVAVDVDDIMSVRAGWTDAEKAKRIYTGLTRGANITVVKDSRSNNFSVSNVKETNDVINATKTSKKVESVVTAPDKSIEGFVLHSGGASGADSIWGEVGEQYGVVAKHYMHPEQVGQKNQPPKGNTIISAEDVSEGAVEIARAAKRMYGYKYDTVKDLNLIRDWTQAKNADAVFAVGLLKPKGSKFGNDSRTLLVDSVVGGTGYAVNAAILNNKPVYVFNQEANDKYNVGWYKYDRKTDSYIATSTPTLVENFAGIGTRNINDLGIQAIKDVYTNSVRPKSTKSTVLLPEYTRTSLTKEQKAKIIRKKIQEDLRNLSKGKPVMMNGQLVQASNVRVIPAECISGRYHAKEFGLGPKDTVDKIKRQGPKFFEKKLRVKYRLPDNLPDFCESVIYTPEGAKFMVRSMSTKEIDAFLANDPNVLVDKTFVEKDGVYYKGDKRVTNAEGVTFCTYNDNGKLRKLIILNKKKRPVSSLMRSTFFDTFRIVGKDEASKQLSNDNFNDWVKVRAKRMFDSFEEQLQTIGTRIPTQAMPSFMPMQVIAYTDSEVNDLYVPISLLQRQGADLDIDKEYMLNFGIRANGTAYLHTKLIDSDKYSLDDLYRLDMPTGVSYSEKNDSNATFVTSADLSGDWIDLINRCMKGSEFIKFADDVDEVTKMRFLSELNTHSLTELTERDRQEATKNKVSIAIKKVTKSVENQIIAQISVDTSMKALGDIAKKSALANDEKTMTSDNPATKFIMQVQNMVGRQVIGITAVSLKQFFAKTAYWNDYINKFSRVLRNSNDKVETVTNFVAELLKYNPVKDSEFPLANLNFLDLIDEAKEDESLNIKFGLPTYNIGDTHFCDLPIWYGKIGDKGGRSIGARAHKSGKAIMVDLDAMREKWETKAWLDPLRSDSIGLDFQSFEEYLTWNLYHELGHIIMNHRGIIQNDRTPLENAANKFATERILQIRSGNNNPPMYFNGKYCKDFVELLHEMQELADTVDCAALTSALLSAATDRRYRKYLIKIQK